MKYLNICLSMCLAGTITSCGKHASDDHRNTPARTDGGMTSGGGGTVIPNAIGQAQASLLLSKIPQHTALFFNYLSFQMDAPSETNTELAAVLKRFPDPLLMVQKLGSLKIHDATDQPCFFDGKEKDGSFSAQQGICLSSQQLGQKLNATNAYAQTMSLLIHELAHAEGAEEDEALNIQAIVLRTLADTSLAQAEDALSRNQEAVANLEAPIKWLPEFPIANAPSLGDQIQLALTIQGSLVYVINNSLATYSKSKTLEIQGLTAQLFNFYEFSNADPASGIGTDATKATALNSYSAVFGTQNEIGCDVLMNSSVVNSSKDNASSLTPPLPCKLLRLLNPDGSRTNNFQAAHEQLIRTYRNAF